MYFPYGGLIKSRDIICQLDLSCSFLFKFGILRAEAVIMSDQENLHLSSPLIELLNAIHGAKKPLCVCNLKFKSAYYNLAVVFNKLLYNKEL